MKVVWLRHDIYEGVSFYIMKDIKPNYAELARQYHCDLRTVKNIMRLGKAMSWKKQEKRQREYQN